MGNLELIAQSRPAKNPAGYVGACLQATSLKAWLCLEAGRAQGALLQSNGSFRGFHR